MESEQHSFKPMFPSKFATEGFFGNPLSNMPSYTYYSKLSICHPTVVHNLGKVPKEQKIIIAETGTTSIFTISDLELFHTMGSQEEIRTAVAKIVNITIIETHGSALLDYINQACQDLQIRTPKEATYLLEIMFKNGNAEDVSPGQSEYYFVYPLTFVSMNIQITEAGGQYRIRANEPGLSALYGTAGPATNNVCAIPAKNLGEFIQGFNRFLNTCAQDEVEACHHDIKDNYVVLIPKEWESYKFANLEGAEKGNKQTARYFKDPSKLLIQIPKGAKVPDIITSVFSSIVEFQKIKTSDGRGFMKKETASLSDKPAEIASYFRLVADTHFGDYDEKRKLYARTYIWWFADYKEPAMYDPNHMKSFNDPGIMRKRVTNLIKEGLLTKRYDYNYTGINTEVIRFDMNLNLSYFRTLPIRAGEQGQSNDRQNATKATDTQKKEEDAPKNKDKKPFKSQGGAAYAQRLAGGALSSRNRIAGDRDNIRKSSGNYLESYALPDPSDEISFHQVSSNTEETSGEAQGIASSDNSAGTIQFGNAHMSLAGGSEFVQIDLDIKGDPYWMGMSNLNQQYRDTQTGIANFAMYQNGAQMFWLNVKSPSEPDETTGKMQFTPSIMSGIFKVISVVSRFINGSFTQSVTADRDLGTNEAKARSTLLRFTNEKELETEAVMAIADTESAVAAEGIRERKKERIASNARLESQGYEKRS